MLDLRTSALGYIGEVLRACKVGVLDLRTSALGYIGEVLRACKVMRIVEVFCFPYG